MEGGAGQPDPERAPPGRRKGLAELVEESRKTWGRCWRDKENLREEEKPNIIFGVEMGFCFFCIFKTRKVKLISIIAPPLASEDCFRPG